MASLGDVHGEGLLLVPTGRAPVADVVAIPDVSQTPEQLAGLSEGIDPGSQFARRLAESGCRVVVPVLIDTANLGSNQLHGIDRPVKSLSHREFIYRPAFELGRHVIGYEIEKVMAAVDWMAEESKSKG